MSNQASAAYNTGAGLQYLGRWISGSGIGGAEISAYDPATQRMFVTNGATNQIDIVDISNPSSPKKLKSIVLAAQGVIGIQSVAVREGLVAIAASLVSNQASGKVYFADADGNLIKGVENGVPVGSLPDHVGFSPDGRYVVTANEGEPSSYCLTGGTLPTTTDPYGTVSIIDVTGTVPSAATTVNFEDFNDRAGAITFQGGRIFGPGATTAQDVEPEYITFSADSKYAYVSLQENNAVATIDMASKKVIQVSGLGYKKYSEAGKGLDAISNGTPEVANQNVQGMYMPDNMATLTGADGTTYILSANEGDARSYPCLLGGTDTAVVQSEDQKLSSVYDSTDSAITTLQGVTGGLNVTQFAPATARAIQVTSSTKVKTAYSFGARSFSVWKPTNLDGVDTMTQVWDSGDQLETITAQRNGAGYNGDWNTTNGGPNDRDTRSAKKGPEPEGIAVGKAYGTNWIVVGMERDGGIALYNGDNPLAPTFVDYINTSNRAGNLISGKTTASAGDVSPEGITFISEDDSPTGAALILASYELSGTVGIYQIPRKTPAAPRSPSVKATGGTITVKFGEPADLGWAATGLTYKVLCKSPKGKLSATSVRTKVTLKVPAAKKAIYKCTVTPSTSLGTGTTSTAKTVVVK